MDVVSMDNAATAPGTTIYLDHAATTPTDPAVIEAMLPYWQETWGNPSSLYAAGRQARAALDRARAALATVLHCHPREITITSGGSESDNLALRGLVAEARRAIPRPHLITTAVEHHAILHTAAALEKDGVEVTYLPVDEHGAVSPDDLAAAIRPETCLVSIIYANNEVGTVNPIPALAAVARARQIPFHTDAVQAPGALPLAVDNLDVDLLSLSAHKFNGPKGIGLLYTRCGTRWTPQITGGGQEMNRRAGTENVAYAVGMAVALERAEAERPRAVAYSAALRDRLIARVMAEIPDVRLNGHPTRRLANNANLGFAGVEAESLLILLDAEGIAASAGSACASGSIEPSHVLTAMSVPESAALGTLRFTVGPENTVAEIEAVADLLPHLVARLRSLAPLAV
ncbi:MAG: cysteine desulfurase [Thermomicrobia bacterium]|nr:cysteine desulfurase [Thermomicrobia bacterium]